MSVAQDNVASRSESSNSVQGSATEDEQAAYHPAYSDAIHHEKCSSLSTQKVGAFDGLQDRLSAVTAAWPTADYNPKNWSRARRIYHISVPPVFAFICTFGSSVYTSGISDVMAEFGVSQVAAELGLTLYVLGLGWGPCIAAPMSEHLGRRAVYFITFAASMFFTLGAGFSRTFATLMACRFFAGFFSGPVLAVGSGTIADMMQPIDRAIAMAIFTGSAFLGPVLGPVIAGFVVEKRDWRWTMWLILFWSALGIVYLLPLQETHRPTILKREAKTMAQAAARKRKSPTTVPENTVEMPVTKALSSTSKYTVSGGSAAFRDFLFVTLLRPLKMLFTEPILFVFSVYIAFSFGVFYGFFGAFPLVFQGVYNFSLGSSGLAWLGLLVGTLIGILIVCACDFLIYRRRHRAARAVALADGKDPELVNLAAENRLYGAMICCFGMPIALFWFGWTARADIHWISPIIASVFFTIGNFSVFLSGSMYLVDTYGPLLGASALAANGLARYIMAATFPLFTRQMYERLGIGWASSLFGFISVALCAVPFVLFLYGKRIRERSGRTEVAL